MALALFDRVQETSTTAGTGSIVLAGAVSGFQSFAVVGNGNTCYYTIVDGSAWEVGVGTYSTSGPTLARTTILSNSNGNTSPLTLTANSKSVFLTYPASKSVNLNESGNVSPLGTVVSGIWNGTTIGVAYGGTGVTASSGANSVVLRDSNQNITVNRINQGIQTITASGGTTVLTAASQFNQALVGTGGHTFRLPDATTLTDTTTFQFNNNATGTLTIQNNAGTTIGSIASGGAAGIALLSNATVGGTWDVHAYIPENVTWGTNALTLGSTVISGGTWQGGTIQTGYGGTGLTSYTSGGAVYANSSSTLTSGTLPVTAGGTGNTTGNSATTSQTNFSNLTISGSQVLSAANYNSYAPTLTGGGASGTWGISISGNAATATTAANYLPLAGGTMTGALLVSATVAAPSNSTPTALSYGRLQGYGDININADTDGSTTEYVFITAGYTTANSNAANGLAVGYNTLTWKNNVILHAGNYNSYAPTLTGGGASGTWGINITGNAATATSATDNTKLPLAGGTMTGNILFADSGTTKRGIQGISGTNDYWFIGGGATASNSGFMEIASGDDAQTPGTSEPIYVSQYGPGDPLTGTLVRRASLLDANGNTSFPGTISNPSIWINNGVNTGAWNENIRLFDTSQGVSTIAFGASGTSGQPRNAFVSYASNMSVFSGATVVENIYNNYLVATGSYRAPIFYDSDDTAYYGDFNNTSVFSKLTLNGKQTSVNTGAPPASGTSTPAIERMYGGFATYGEVLDFGMNVGPTYGWIQATNYTNLAVNYPMLLNPNGGGVGVGIASVPEARFHVRQSAPGGIGGMPSGVTMISDSASNNYLLFRNSADNSTYAGLAFQDNNMGGYVIFGNSGVGDQMYIAGYSGGALQQGFSDSINPGARTTIASWNSTGLQVNSGDMRAPIYYDSNNTAYYGDFAGTSVFNGLQLASNLSFSNSGTTKRGVFGTMADNDFWFVGGGGTGSNAGFLEIATGDDGQSPPGAEPIYVSQYGPGDPLTGTLVRRASLLDGNGNTSFPGSLSFNGTIPTGASTNLYVGRNLGATNYNAVSLNGNSSDSGNMGLTGGGVGDSTLYINSPGNIILRTSSFAYSNTISSFAQFAGSTRSPIFYDSDNTGYYADFASTAGDCARFAGGIVVSQGNVTGNGIILADDGDIVDLNDGYCAMRFSSGVRIHSANRSGGPVITLSNTGAITCSSVNTNAVLSGTAGAGGAEVGTYGFMRSYSSGTTYVIGSTASGSVLNFSAAGGNNLGTGAGTWRCMGYSSPPGSGSYQDITLWLRIS